MNVPVVDLSKNPKQYEYFIEVVKSCQGYNQKRKFAYGGAIRGGKTFVTLFILIWLCKKYPGSRWVVIRESFPSLQKTTIESLVKILVYSKNWQWSRDKGNYFIQNTLGSRIYFMAESIERDPNLLAFLGLECNGFFLEQAEELSEKTWQIAMSRAGSWYIDPMPPAFMFTTFNPTQRWPKQKFYESSLDGTLPEDYFYMNAKPSDNAYVTQDQWNTWGQMDERYQLQFIEGDWTDFDDIDPRWAYEFGDRHIEDSIRFIQSMDVHLSFDFNREPLTCIACQKSPQIGLSNSFTHFIKQFKGDWQLREICQQIRTTFPASRFFVTGDSSGNKGDVGYESRNETHYTMIKKYLRLNDSQMHLSKSNLEHHDSRLLVNTALAVLPNVKFAKTLIMNDGRIIEGCPTLIAEYKKAKVDVTNNRPGMLKKDRKNDEEKENKLDLFDGSRYFWQKYYREYLEKMIPTS
jgi:phage terminase large subunit